MTAFYRFPDEQTFQETARPEVPVDVIGLIQVGEAEIDGELVPVYAEGWHVNTLSPVDDWAQYEVFPEAPQRIFG